MIKEARSALGVELEAALQEVRAWKRGDVALEVREFEPMSPERVKAIRSGTARSTRDFERRFGIPARTVEGWEQGHRKPDLSARILLQVIEQRPDAVEEALQAGAKRRHSAQR
ncbi:MAG TPA: transcriptional regulator [Hyphomicrobiales bacterium]|nr:transcriptional regulator [Hyphomicrobiales bacterium]